MEDIKRNMMMELHTKAKEEFLFISGALTNRKLNGINELDVKGTILKKIKIQSRVHFCLGKYRLSLDIF